MNFAIGPSGHAVDVALEEMNAETAERLRTKTETAQAPLEVQIVTALNGEALVDKQLLRAAYDAIVAGQLELSRAISTIGAQELALDKLESALRDADLAINPPDRDGISLVEWNTRLKAATATIRAVLRMPA